ncbi:hypothetical protein [Nostocoides jenkinsii]|nr:hypothetical protein [Tetrasphaera jenkinsii]
MMPGPVVSESGCPACTVVVPVERDDTLTVHDADGKACLGSGQPHDPHLVDGKRCYGCGAANADCGDTGCCAWCRIAVATAVFVWPVA